MSLEVELKFRLPDAANMETLLRQRGAIETGTEIQTDRYFNHPSRDFRSTDEAFRVRTSGNENCITYKGAVLGTAAKTRHEIEIGFADGSQTVLQLMDVLRLLSFRFVREVEKSRRSFTLQANGYTFELAVDTVPGLGTFLEIELLADSDQRHVAEQAVWELARSLELTTSEKRSYLDLLLEADARTPQSAMTTSN